MYSNSLQHLGLSLHIPSLSWHTLMQCCWKPSSHFFELLVKRSSITFTVTSRALNNHFPLSLSSLISQFFSSLSLSPLSGLSSLSKHLHMLCPHLEHAVLSTSCTLTHSSGLRPDGIFPGKSSLTFREHQVATNYYVHLCSDRQEEHEQTQILSHYKFSIHSTFLPSICHIK